MVMALFKAPWRRKKYFLVDGIVREEPAIQNIIMALLGKPCRKKK